MFIRILALSLIFGASSLFAAPSGGRVTAGDGDLSNPLNLIQQSEHLGTSWESFDIASGEVVNISQPSTSALISIKVRNGSATNIDGTLNANGKVALENPAGVLFGAGSVVNVGGLLASASASAVQANGVINAPLGEVHLQSLSNNNVVNVGGAIEAQRIIVEGANEVKLGSTASLTASKEVLVGGGFQGKGEITNAQKTIVESGALITAPRVIIWSDVSTNFQGSINAEGGFVEVSGKQHLASFDIFKVKAAKLLLDPDSITISTSTANDDEISDGAIAIGDGGDSVTFVISAAAIQDYDGAVSLAANNITVNTAITKSNGALTLDGGATNINQNITITGHNLTIISFALTFTRDRPITLSGAAVSLSSTSSAGTASNQNLTITATGVLTMSGDFDIGTGNASLSFGGDSTQTPSPTSLLTDDLTLTGTGTSTQINLADWMSGAGRNLTLIVETGSVALIDLNLGDDAKTSVPRGDLTIKAKASFVLRSGTYTIKAKDISITLTDTRDGEFAGFSSGVGHLKLNATGNITISVRHINFFANNGPFDLELVAGGEIVFAKDTTITAARNLTLDASTIKAESTDEDGMTTLHSLVMARIRGKLTFADDKPTTITAANITLDANDNVATASGQDLTLIAENGLVTIEGINLANADDTSRGNLTIRTGYITTGINESSYTIKANNITITATSEDNFTEEAPGPALQFANASTTFNALGNITISAAYINFHNFDGLRRDWTLIAGGEIVFTKGTSIRANNITLGGTIKAESTDEDNITTQHNLSLDARGKMTFAADKATTITAANITLNSAALNAGTASNQALTLTTPGVLTMSGKYNTGTGDASFTFGGTFAQTPAPDSFLTDDLTLTYTAASDSLNSLVYNIWMGASGRNLTFNSANNALFIEGATINLGMGDFVANVQELAIITSDATIMARDITIGKNTGTRAFGLSSANLTLDASRNIRFNIGSLSKDSRSYDLSIDADGEIIFAQNTTFSARNITIGGTIKAQTENEDGDITLHNLSLAATAGQINFSADTTITAADITLVSTTKGTADSNPDLTLTAAGIVTLGGALNVGTGDMVITSGTSASGTDQPINFSTSLATTLTGMNITLTSSGGTPTASGQDFTITAEGIVTLGGAFDTGAGNIAIASGTDQPINFSTALATSLTGAQVKLTSTGGTLIPTTHDLTFTASSNVAIRGSFETTGNITFNTSSVDATDGQGFGILSLTAGGQILFTEDVFFISDAITLNSNTIKGQTAGDTPMGVVLGIRGNITFSSTQATTISGGDIDINFSTASTSGQDLTIIASGNLTLEGALDIGNDATTGNTLRLTAGSGAGVGTIIFTDTPRLTAAAIFLTQDGDPFPTAAPIVTFTLPAAEDKPTINYLGSGAQGEVEWANQAGIFSDEDINLGTLLAQNGELEGKDSDDSSGNIVIDLTTEEDEGDQNFILHADENNLILPDEMVMITAKVISINAKSIRNAENSEGITKPLMLVATESVVINANITSSASIIIKAPNVIFSGSKPVRLSGTNITIELPDDMDTPSDNPAANNQNVELVASGDIMLNNSINAGFGTLKLQATGEIMTTRANVMIMGNRVVLDASADNSISGGLTIISMNDIRLLGNIETEGNVILRAGGSIITPDAATTIEATGASSDITFEQKYAIRQSLALTLKAAGEITIIGRLDRGTAGITLDGGSLDLTRASLIAAEITCRPIPVGASAGACQ